MATGLFAGVESNFARVREKERRAVSWRAVHSWKFKIAILYVVASPGDLKEDWEIATEARHWGREAESMNSDYTPKQGRYLAFIYYYTKIHGVPPAEADMQGYFRVSPPAVHEMVKSLERHGFIQREPGKPRSIRLLLSRAELPDLD